MFPYLVIILGILFLPMAFTRADQIAPADAVIQLLNLFASHSDPLATANAGKLLNSGMSPTEIFTTDLHKPISYLVGWNSPDTTRSLSMMLAAYVATHPEQFPQGLPAAGAVTNPLRLGAFFEGLFPLGPRTSYLFRKDLDKLQPLLDDSWLNAAASNGAIHLHQLLLAHRGELENILLSYQKTENDIALICLGETIANFTDALRKIEPGGFSTRTLAHVMAGSLGMNNTDQEEYLALIEIATAWANEHPELIVVLRELRDPSALSMLEARLLWQKSEREASLKQLVSNSGTGPWIKAQYVIRIFSNSSLSDSEAISLIRLLPTEVLVACMKLSKVGNPHPRQVRVTELIAAQLLSRDDTKQTIK